MDSDPQAHPHDENTGLLPDLEFETLLPQAPFGELHRRTIDQPIDQVWQSLLSLPSSEIKLLQPLFALRGLPARVLGKTPPMPAGGRPVLELFAEEGFIMLRHDDHPVDGRAVLIFGAAGKFWSPAHNAPIPFDSPAEFIAFDKPGYAKTVARFEAHTHGNQTIIATETVVAGTDQASSNKFRPYWMLIRGPSGLLRRSWLAAIDRRATR